MVGTLTRSPERCPERWNPPWWRADGACRQCRSDLRVPEPAGGSHNVDVRLQDQLLPRRALRFRQGGCRAARRRAAPDRRAGGRGRRQNVGRSLVIQTQAVLQGALMGYQPRRPSPTHRFRGRALRTGRTGAAVDDACPSGGLFDPVDIDDRNLRDTHLRLRTATSAGGPPGSSTEDPSATRFSRGGQDHQHRPRRTCVRRAQRARTSRLLPRHAPRRSKAELEKRAQVRRAATAASRA